MDSNRPPSLKPNNQDSLVWSLFLLGGAEDSVDVEDLYLKCFSLTPARLGWRTRPDIPDLKKIAKALQSVEAKTHVGLLHKIDMYHRTLSQTGVEWIAAHETTLRNLYSGAAPIPASGRNKYERLRKRIRSNRIIELENPSIVEVASALECAPTSSPEVWGTRVVQLEKAAFVLSDPLLAEFAVRVIECLLKNGIEL
jgi:hypothetical protein